MTFLSKLGSALAQGLALATGIWPLVSKFFGAKASAVESTTVNDLTSIGSIVVQVESVLQTAGSGATKLAAATPLVANIVKTSELVSGHDIQNETLFIQGCTKITSGVADILNSLNANTVQTSGKVVAISTATPKSGPVTPQQAPASKAS